MNSQDEDMSVHDAMNSPRDLRLHPYRGHIGHTAPIPWSVTTDAAHKETSGYVLQY